ncbi:MAG TPA: hypothetical protein VFC67_14720 [Prolixibacteraceae bacterium]|nr:hypothetical protein [Prolixibacteraceae bacterium]
MIQPYNLFLIGGTDLETLEINQLLTANIFAEGGKLARHLLVWVPKFTNIQNLLNNSQTIASIELLQILNTTPAPGGSTNIISNTLNLPLYPPRIPGCGLNKTNLNKQLKFNSYEKFNQRYCAR